MCGWARLAAAFTLVFLSGAPAGARQAPSFDHLRLLDDLAAGLLREAWLGSDGFRRDEPTFETEAALAVEEQVKQELGGSGGAR